MRTRPPASPRPRSRADAKADTRRRVMDAAEAVFSREGFHGASLDQVAREAGFTKGAVYSTFASKADLFFALLERRAARQVGDLGATVAGDAAAFVRANAARMAAAVAGEPEWWAAVIEFMTFAGRDPELQARYAEHHDRTREAIGAAVARWAGDRGVRPALDERALGTAVLAITNGLTLERLLSPGDVPDDLYAEVQLALLEHALRPAAESSR